MHNSKSKEEYDNYVKLNVVKWLKMKTMNKFGLYIKKQWIDSRFNKWQLFYREVGLASTNSQIESYNARIKGDFTDRTFFVAESESSPSISNTNVQSPISVIQNSPILIACSKRITRSQISKVVDSPTIKQNTELVAPLKSRRGRPPKMSKALQFD